MRYKVEYSPDAELHLRVLTSRQRATVLDEVETQLIYEPVAETKHRKRMRPNVLAPWELRIGNLRVYYDVRQPRRTVIILAVGIKERGRVRIGKEIIEL